MGRGLAVCLALILAVSQCSEARHSRHRRQTYDDYGDTLLGDEANEDEAQNDTELNENPKPVSAPAVILTAPQKYEADAGKDIRLECKVSPENTVVQWYKNNVAYFLGNIEMHPEAKERYSIAPKSKDLVITNAKASDNGVFRCETVHAVPVSVNHSVLVYEKPEVYNMTATNDGRVGEGWELTIKCHVTGSPKPTIIWSITRDGRNHRLPENYGDFKVEDNVFSVYIKHAKPENSGQYYCYAFNKVGNHQAETSVIVNPKPRVHVPKSVVNSAVQIEAVLECAAHVLPTDRPTIRWYKDDKRIEAVEPNYMISTYGAYSNLTVRPNTDEDFGTFTCEAENQYGTHSRSIELVQRPVVDSIISEGSKVSWVVHSHQPLEEMELQLTRVTEEPTEDDVKRLLVPLPEGGRSKYDISYSLDDKQVQAGEYNAVVKVKNTKSWGGSSEPVAVKIEDAQPQYIQHASVFRTNAGHSIRPVGTALSTILMYLLVRML